LSTDGKHIDLTLALSEVAALNQSLHLRR